MDRSQHYGKFGITLSYISDDVASFVTHAYHERIDIYHHTCTRPLPRKDDTVPFYSCGCNKKRINKFLQQRGKIKESSHRDVLV